MMMMMVMMGDETTATSSLELPTTSTDVWLSIKRFSWVEHLAGTWRGNYGYGNDLDENTENDADLDENTENDADQLKILKITGISPVHLTRGWL